MVPVPVVPDVPPDPGFVVCWAVVDPDVPVPLLPAVVVAEDVAPEPAADPVVPPVAPAETGELGAVTPLVWHAVVWAACALSGPPARKSAASAAPVPATAAAAACV